jgi:hypothetical protein
MTDSVSLLASRRRYRHKVSGSEYTFIGYADHTETLDQFVIYAGIDGHIWARPRAMFEDGRFEPVEVDKAQNARPSE